MEIESGEAWAAGVRGYSLSELRVQGYLQGWGKTGPGPPSIGILLFMRADRSNKRAL